MSTDYAKGLPDKNKYASISNKNGRTRLVVQKHIADKAGTHFDIRLHDKDKSHSWAARYFIRSYPLLVQTSFGPKRPLHRKYIF